MPADPAEIVAREIELESARAGIPFVIVSVVDTEFGPLFYWDSAKYLQSGAVEDMILGNLPILYDTELGKTAMVHPLPTLEEGLDEYRQERKVPSK